MNVAAEPKLAAAVTNVVGLGVIGGVGYSPEMLKEQIDELKSYLNDKNAPFGVDLLLPQVGSAARYTPPLHYLFPLSTHPQDKFRRDGLLHRSSAASFSLAASTGE